ncbi:YdeI family protein [Streptomyces sp. NBC_00829]|uniref:YdeI/OmpD-associated family protein n=1 Tax=Streptomyces sp. NBC_00829 TaxID=2903679 RepID=UPI0038660997|nr:YdeI/OmpD-associated family protein [Streptomyces sp. NBC_00829]
MESINGVEVLAFADAAQWESWLDEHYVVESGVWLKLAKKNSGIASVTAAEVIDVALCYGWIDGQRRSCDETYFLQKITPRRPRSLWSQVNIRKVEALTEAGRMREPGARAVREAKADGRWSAAYASQRNAAVPPDLMVALTDNEQAKAFFEQLNKTEKYAVIHRLLTAKTPDTRASRLRRMMASLEAGRRIR